MLAPHGCDSELKPRVRKSATLLAEEQGHCEGYPWCLSLHHTIGTQPNISAMRSAGCSPMPRGWQSGKVATNVDLPSCGPLNPVDEYLRGRHFDFPRALLACALGEPCHCTLKRKN